MTDKINAGSEQAMLDALRKIKTLLHPGQRMITTQVAQLACDFANDAIAAATMPEKPALVQPAPERQITLTRERAIEMMQAWSDLGYEHRRNLRIASERSTGDLLAHCELHDGSDKGWILYAFTLDDIQRGVDRALGKWSPLSNWYKASMYECLSNGTEDCDQVDAVMQMAVFNDYIYG